MSTPNPDDKEDFAEMFKEEYEKLTPEQRESLNESSRSFGANLSSFSSFMRESLGLPISAFDDLIKPETSEWVAIVKLSTFLEASLNHLIVGYFQDERLYPVIERLDIAEKTKGKLAFVKALNLLPSEHQSFIKHFAEIRNSLVHDISNLDFDLRKYFSNLEPKSRKSFFAKMTVISESLFPIPENKMQQTIDTVPLFPLYISVMATMVLCCKAGRSTSPEPLKSNPKAP